MEEMCFMPCPQDCEMSPWSPWTKCHVEHCGIGYQNRSRYVIESELDGGRQCPDLYEGEVNCNRFVWSCLFVWHGGDDDEGFR